MRVSPGNQMAIVAQLSAGALSHELQDCQDTNHMAVVLLHKRMMHGPHLLPCRLGEPLMQVIVDMCTQATSPTSSPKCCLQLHRSVLAFCSHAHEPA